MKFAQRILLPLITIALLANGNQVSASVQEPPPETVTVGDGRQ